MAFSWLKKNKNKRDHEPAEKQVARIQEVEKTAPESVTTGIAPEEILESEDQTTSPDQTANTGFSDEPVDDTTAARESIGYFKRLKNRLSRTRRNFSGGFEKVFAGKKKIDEDALEELEELLITSVIGVHTTMPLME